ncbi:MAG: phage portal protein [Bacteroidales bacterium]|nr:phage portal protein [Candidatus Scybalousia scybalohippi]
MGFLNIFKPLRKTTISRWQELGTYNSVFSVFGPDAYKSEIVRSCIRPLADFSAKSNAKCSDERMEKILNERPNLYMNGKDFLYKVRTFLELNNSCFIYIQRDSRLKVIGFYPVPYQYFEAYEYQNGLFLKFSFANGKTLTLPWSDLAVVRKDYNKSDIAGDDNNAILSVLELQKTTNEGLANSIKATANLRGILKNTKSMLDPKKVKEDKDRFVNDYLNLENTGGIAALDSTQEFTPIKMEPTTATYEQMKEIRENIYRYFGVNDSIIMANIKTEELENFYRLRIEPFLLALSRELSSKVYPKGEEFIVYEADAGQFITMSQKLELFQKVVLYAGMSINEWRNLMNLPPVEGGDEMIMRLDASSATVAKEGKDDE